MDRSVTAMSEAVSDNGSCKIYNEADEVVRELQRLLLPYWTEEALRKGLAALETAQKQTDREIDAGYDEGTTQDYLSDIRRVSEELRCR